MMTNNYNKLSAQMHDSLREMPGIRTTKLRTSDSVKGLQSEKAGLINHIWGVRLIFI